MSKNKALLNIIITIIINGLLVNSVLADRSSKEIATDAAIFSEIKTKLLMERNVGMNDVQVEVNRGYVTLKGIIDSEQQVQTIANIVMSIKDVKDIDAENLRLSKSKTPITDAFLTAKAVGRIQQLKVDKIIANENDISVETKNKVVFLKGRSIGQKDKNTIIDSVRDLSKVKAVKEEIYVK